MTRSVAKHSYIRGMRGRARARAHVNYIQYRRGEDRTDGKPRAFFSDERDDIQGREVKKDIKEMEKAPVVCHKLILSPGVEGVDIKAYTRDVLAQTGRQKGLDLDWRAVVHTNTDHDHSHVIVFGKDKNGREVQFDKNDYKRMRETGDRYLDREHFLQKYLVKDRVEERDRGDNVFESLVRDLNGGKDDREKSKQKREPRPEWDKDKAIAYLPEKEKIRVDEKVYTKFSPLDDLQELKEKLSERAEDGLSKKERDNLGKWIWIKEKAGDEYYEWLAKSTWDKKRRREEKAFMDLDEHRRLDKDLDKKWQPDHERRQSKGWKQRMYEQRGKYDAEHGYYTYMIEKQRLEDLKSRYPDRAEEIDQQLIELEKSNREQWRESRAWKDFNSLLGEGWKSIDKEKAREESTDRKPDGEEASKDKQGKIDERASKEKEEQERSQESKQFTDAMAREELTQSSGDQAEKAKDQTSGLDKDRDDDMDRGGR